MTVAIARFGRPECLRSGVTTVGDSSFTGATAIACAELGLRAIVYLEVFGARPADEALRQFEEKRRRRRARARSVRLGVSPHAPTARTRSTPPAPSSASRSARTSPRASASASGCSAARADRRSGHLLVDPPGETGSVLPSDGLLGPHCGGALRPGGRRRRRAARRARRRRPLPSLERAPRLRCRPPEEPHGRRSASASVRTARRPLPRSTSSRRCAPRSILRPGARGAAGRAPRRRGAPSSLRSARLVRSVWTEQIGSCARQAGRPRCRLTARVAVRIGRTPRGRSSWRLAERVAQSSWTASFETR